MADSLLDARGRGTTSPGAVSRLVLLADSNARSARLARPLLFNSGYDVALCGDGETALRKAIALSPVALVMDPELRGVHGLEVLARLKRQPRPVPVVLTCRDDRFRDDHLVRTYPRLVYVSKPYDRHDLATALEACLETRESAAATLGPDDGFVRAIADGPTAGVLRTPALEVGVCARGRFRDTFFRVLPIDAHRAGLFVVEREVGPEDTGPVFRELESTLDEAVGAGASPQEVLRRADRAVRIVEPGMLLAALSLEVDDRGRELELCRAGFHAPLAATPGGSPAEVHLPFGPLLGATTDGSPGRCFRTVRFPFPEDGALLLRSTGALLAVSRQIPDLGQRLFSGFMRERAGSSIAAALEALLGLLGALGVQGPGRDLLLLLVRRRSATPRAG